MRRLSWWLALHQFSLVTRDAMLESVVLCETEKTSFEMIRYHLVLQHRGPDIMTLSEYTDLEY